MVHRVTTSDNKWQGMTRVTTNGNNEWQQLTASGKTNGSGTVHFKEWMIVIIFVTKTDGLLQGRDSCNQRG